MKSLYFLAIMLAVGCHKKPKQPPQVDEITFGYLRHTADVPRVSSAVMALSCTQPEITAQEIEVAGETRTELRLPQGGVGCEIAIKSLMLGDLRFVQDHNTDYDWRAGSIVELLAESNDRHLVRVEIERQLPEMLTENRADNSFLFRVLKLQNADRIINTTTGVRLTANVHGLLFTTWIARGARVLPASLFSRAAVRGNPYLLTRQARFAFSCASQLERAHIVNADKIVCGTNTYRELSFAMLSGRINLAAARTADLCNTVKMTDLPLHNTVISLPYTSMPRHMSALTMIVLRSKYLDATSGEFHQSCHLYPIAPHLAPWTESYRNGTLRH